VVDVPWPSSTYSRVGTTTFTGSDVTVFRVTVPSGAPVGNSYGKFSGIYSTSQQPLRTGALSTQPCDFSTSLAPGAYVKSSTTIYIPYRVGSGDGYYPGLTPGATYYLSVKNLNCAVGSNCNMWMDLYKPN
jgi:hypothetical protein